MKTPPVTRFTCLQRQIVFLTFALLFCAQLPAWSQNRNLTAAVLVNAQNATGYNPSPTNPGEFQRFAERYLTHLQVPYELFDVASAAPPVDISSRQLIIAGHSRLLLPISWRNAIANAVNAGTGFVNLDSDTAIGNESHISTIFGATGSAAGTPASQISVPSAVAPNGATPHYIAALQKKFDDPSGNLVYPFHADAGGIVRTAVSTVLTNATGTVIAHLGNDPLILAKTHGSGRAVHFGTLDYLRADRFGFLMGVDDLFWRSLVWAARKPFVVRGYPRLWSVQMDDQRPGWGSRVRDMYDPTLTGQVSTDGTGGQWKVTGYVFTDNLAPGSTDRTTVIADINTGKLEISPHSFSDVALGNMYWNPSTGQLTDPQWMTNMNAIDAWKQGNGGADTIPSLSRSLVAHFWDLSNNTGYDLWNRYGFRYVTSIQKPGFLATGQHNGAERLPVRPFWIYETPPKTTISQSFATENFPLFFADDYMVGSRSGLPAQQFFLFATQYLDFSKYSRVDFSWPNASGTPVPTVASSVAQLQQYTWRHWSGLGPLQLFTHDAINYENSSAPDRQAVIALSSAWLNTNGVRHMFMDDLGDYIYARSKSTLTQAAFNGTQITYTFTGSTLTADGSPVSTELLVFQGDKEGSSQRISGFNNGLQVTQSLPPSIQSVTPSSGPAGGGTSVTITGTGFTPDVTVYFGQTIAATATVVNSSTIQTVTPAAAAGTVEVKITSANGTSTLPASFTFIPACPCTGWNAITSPSRVDSGDASAIEVGVKFRSDVDGYISGIRFYKSSANNGTHIGHLWSRNGTLLASATFSSETTTGWQQVMFPSAVPITAGTTYVASYFAPNGHHSVDLGYFASTGVDSPPLHFLREAVDGGNGVYAYSTSPTFPASTFQSSNYWVDVVFNTTPGPIVLSTSPVSGAAGVSTLASVRAVFSQDLNPATVNSTTFRLLDPSNNPIPASVTYNASTSTATLTPSSALVAATQYKAIITGGSNGIKNTSGAPMSSDVSWLFTTGQPVNCPCSGWTSSTTPATLDSGETQALELGVKFRSDVDGYITGIRFYKSSANTGTHIGHLWSSTGTLLASATFTGETASGWQQVTFQTAVAITAGTTYVASYFAPNGHYSVNSGYFASAGVDNGPIHLLQNGVDGGNGVFIYGTSGGYPINTFQSSNYWVDVVFDTTPGSPTGPTVISMSPASGASGVSTEASVSAVFSQDLNPATVTSTTFRLLDSSSNPVPASVSYNTVTATLTPTSPMTPSSSYTVILTGGSNGIKNTAGTPMSSDVSWSFTTAQPANCPCSIWESSATPSVAASSDATAVEVGVKFRSDVSGYITGLRFYKGSSNTGTHIGNLWTRNGTLLASATFANETASGWQEVSFPTAVPITAGTTYLASYYAPTGHYSLNFDYFATTGADNAPLHFLGDGVDGPNGVFSYGSTSIFPTSTFRSSNYWVDVVFNTTVAASLGSLSVNPTAVQGGSSSTGTVTLTIAAPTGGATIALSSSDPAVASVPASVTIPAGATTATFPITTNTVANSTSVTLTGSFNGTRTAVLSVSVAGVSALSLSPTSVVSGATATGTVTLPTAAPSGGAEVALSSADTAVASVSASVTVPAGATSATFTVSTSGVATSSTVIISASYSGTTRTANLTVTPASLSSVSISPATVVGGASSTGTITLNGNAPTGGAVVSLSETNAAATVPASVTVAAGQKTATFEITTVPVTSTTTGTISGSYNVVTRTSGTFTVNPPALSSVSLSPRNLTGGSQSTGTITLTGATAADETVALTTTNSAATVPVNVIVPAGARTVTFVVTTVPVSSVATGTVSAIYRGITRTSLTLTVNPPALSTLTLNPTSVLGGAQSTGTVNLSGLAAVDTTITLVSNRTSAQVPPSVVVPAGAQNATFAITTTPVSATTTATVSAIYNGTTRNASLTIRPPQLASLTLNPTSVRAGSTSTGTVVLNGPAPSTGMSVSLSSSNRAVATVPSSVLVPAGQTTTSFTVNTFLAGSATISGTRGVTQSATLTVTLF